MMKEMCAGALDVARDCKVKLDFSDASVKNVEKILGDMHRHYRKTKDDTGLRGLALMFAAYLGEVIRKKARKGVWKRDHPDVGKDSFPFYVGKDDALFLYGWCMKRIFDGKGDDVWAKYRVLILGPE